MNPNYEIHGIAVVVILNVAIHAYQILRDNGGIRGIALTIWRGKDAAPKQETKTP